MVCWWYNIEQLIIILPFSYYNFFLSTTVTQYGCSATDNVTVTVNDAPNVGVSGGSSQAACQGGSLTLSGTGASSYSWNNGVTDGQSFSAPGTTTVSYTHLRAHETR